MDSVSNAAAIEKAHVEYRKYKEKTLTPVEEAYLQSLRAAEKKSKPNRKRERKKPEQTSSIISKVWIMCGPMRDDSVSYGDYLEQLTCLIFLKMSDEYSRPPYKRDTGIPAVFTWPDMNMLTGAALEEQYKNMLETLGEQGGILGQIFKGAISKVSNAAVLYRIVQMS